MSVVLRVLLVEDSEKDAELLLEALRHDGYNPLHTRVQNAAATQTALIDKQWDAILCDNSMPGFDARSAPHLLQQMGVETPLIIVAGTIGEEEAVGAVKLGATDYLLKDRLLRLGAAVGKALDESTSVYSPNREGGESYERPRHQHWRMLITQMVNCDRHCLFFRLCR